MWATASAAALFASAAVVPRGAHLLALLGVAALLVMLQDLARYTAVANGSPTRALLADTVWLVPCIGALVVDIGSTWALSAASGLVVWLAACAASMAVCLSTRLLARPRFSGLWSWWLGDERRRHLGADSVLSGLAPVANGGGAALVAGASAVAAARGAAMLFAPIATLMLAMTLAAVPEAHRRRRTEAVRLLTGLTGLLVLAAVVWGGLALAAPDAVGRALLGDSWELAEPVIPLVGLEYAGLALWTGGTAMLRYASATGVIVRLRLAYAPAAVLLPVLALATNDDPRHFVAALAVLAWVVGCVAVVSGVRAVRR